MKKDMILHTRNEEQCALGRTRVRLKAYCSAPWGVLRVFLLLLMMTVGVNGAWGQDYSGKYYLANNNIKNNVYDYKGYDNVDNFYLCPATEYYNGTTTYSQENDNPFLTTAKTGQADNALWIVEKVENTNYYTFKLKKGDSYLYITVNEAIPNINKSHRRRVHLEPLTNEALTDRNLFTIEQITLQDGIAGYTIGCLDKYKTGENQYLNPAGGNYDQTIANGDDHGGIVGFYKKGNVTNDASGSIWFFEVPKPIIHIDGNNKLSFTCANEDVTIHYTIDGEDPSATGTDDIYNTTDNIQLTEGVHTIKAIAVMKNGNVGYASGVVTQEVKVFSTEHPYLISNNQSPWTVGSETETKNVFYLIPSDVSGGNTTVNTTSMPRPTMEWNIRYTGETDVELYLNIINAKTGGYLYRTGDNIYMKTLSEKTTLENDGDNGFKFYLIKRTDCYSIVPYGITNKYLNKASGNADKGVVNLSGTNNVNSQWKLVTKDAVLNDDILPFTSSDANTSVYYKIQNGNGDNYFIIPPTTTNYATASNATDNATVKKMSWYFEKVKDPTDEDWLTYYKVVNAETGKALHYTEITNTSLNVGTYDDGDDNYKFAFVKSPTTNYYYIVPKSVKDDQLSQISMIWRDNNALKKGATRGNSGNIWKFTIADIFCNDPVFEVEEGVIKIKCNTNAAKIYINTESDTNPTDGSTLYNPTQVTAQNWATTDQVRIKAIAFVNDGTTSASSAVITLLNKPDVTLAGGPYTYKGTAWEPSVTSVSIGEVGNATTAASGTYTTAYANNINPGTASVTITDADNTDYLYIWNVPVTEFTIVPKAVTITANNASKLYNGTPLTESGFTSDALETGDTHTFTVVMTPGSTITNVGTQPNVISTVDGTAVTTGTATTVGNYLVTTVNGTLTVNPKAVTITANDASKEYDGTPLTESGFTLSDLGAGDTHTFTVAMTSESTITDFGTQPNVISTVDGIAVTTGAATAVGNYLVTTVNGTLTINKKSIGDGSLATGYTLDFDESGEVILKYGTHTLTKNEDYTIGDEIPGTKYSSKTISGTGNYTGSLAIRNAIVTFNTDNNNREWSATFVAESAGLTDIGHALPEGMKAFIITDIEGEWAIPEQLNYIPEGVPVLLVTNKETNGFIVKDASVDTPIPDDKKGANKLKEVTGETASFATRQIYVLYKNEFVLNLAGNLGVGKVYMENPTYTPSGGGGAPSRLRIKWGEDTGIKDLQNNGTMDRKNDIWYTIDGRKLNGKPRAKGLYINGVKKIMVK